MQTCQKFPVTSDCADKGSVVTLTGPRRFLVLFLPNPHSTMKCKRPPKILLSGQCGALHHNRSESQGDHFCPSNNEGQDLTVLPCIMSSLLSAPGSLVLIFYSFSLFSHANFCNYAMVFRCVKLAVLINSVNNSLELQAYR